jgi:hypothetical protein
VYSESLQLIAPFIPLFVVKVWEGGLAVFCDDYHSCFVSVCPHSACVSAGMDIVPREATPMLQFVMLQTVY